MTEFNPLEATFVPWPKIPRLNREIVVTEKLDGTNSAVGVLDDGTVYAQSRKKIITPEADNFGFARWVKENEDSLRLILGPGLHFGEWWGKGIQRGYGLEHKQFSLFNTSRWEGVEVPAHEHDIALNTVPVLYEGPFSQEAIENEVEFLAQNGSVAATDLLGAPGWDGEAEGIIVFHTAANLCFKVTIKDDEKPKGSNE